MPSRRGILFLPCLGSSRRRVAPGAAFVFHAAGNGERVGRPRSSFDRFQVSDDDLSGPADIVSYCRGCRRAVAIAESCDHLPVWMKGAATDIATLDIEPYRVRYLRPDTEPQAFND